MTRLLGAVTLAGEVLLRPLCRELTLGRLTSFTCPGVSAMNHARPASRVVAGSGWARNSKEDWYCKFCSDHWGGHYVVRGSRRECYKCHLPKGQCFDGNVVQLGSPTQRIVQRQPAPAEEPNVSSSWKPSCGSSNKAPRRRQATRQVGLQPIIKSWQNSRVRSSSLRGCWLGGDHY